jgi:hypothetical protein
MTDQGLTRAVAAIGELSNSVTALHSEVAQSEVLRTEKIKWIQRVLYVLVPAVVLLVLLAITNFVLLSRTSAAAEDARSTNTLLLGCFLPDSRCAEENRKSTATVMDQIRQTQFAIALCQRQNPIERDPDGSGLILCVQQYYPGFSLPPKPSPSPTS